MKTLIRAAAAAVIIGMAGSLGACASLITGGELIRPGEATGSLQIQNVSRSNSIDVVMVSACSAHTYGLNLCGGATFLLRQRRLSGHAARSLQREKHGLRRDVR